jgi:hypothetical protein
LHEYDIALKSLLRNGRASLLALTSVAIDRWHNVELPEVRNRRVDMLGESADGRLVHIELQSTHDAGMALRMMEYSAAVCRQFGRFPEQVVLYVGEPPLRMGGGLSGPNFSFSCRIADIRELDSERLLASERIEDNIIAILGRVRDQRATVRGVLHRIAAGDPADRDQALAALLIVAGLRRVERVIELVAEETKQMPILDDISEHPLFKRDVDRGLEQGRQQGRHAGELAVLLLVIQKRFGTIPQAVRDRLEAMTIPEIESAALRLLDVKTIEELLA